MTSASLQRRSPLRAPLARAEEPLRPRQVRRTLWSPPRPPRPLRPPRLHRLQSSDPATRLPQTHRGTWRQLRTREGWRLQRRGGQTCSSLLALKRQTRSSHSATWWSPGPSTEAVVSGHSSGLMDPFEPQTQECQTGQRSKSLRI